MDKDDDGTRTASTAWTVATSEAAEGVEGTERMCVDGRFQPILLCEG